MKASECKKNINIINIGPHEGYGSFYAFKLLNIHFGIDQSKVNIISVEGDKTNASLVTQRLKSFSNSIVINKLCAAPEESYNYRFVNKSTTAGYIYVKDIEELERFKPSWSKKGKVEKIESNDVCVNLASITKKLNHVFYLKLDCEGCEYTSLEDMFRKGEIKKVENLGIELHKSEKERKSLFNRLEREFGNSVVINEDYRLAVFSRNKIAQKA